MSIGKPCLLIPNFFASFFKFLLCWGNDPLGLCSTRVFSKHNIVSTHTVYFSNNKESPPNILPPNILHLRYPSFQCTKMGLLYGNHTYMPMDTYTHLYASQSWTHPNSSWEVLEVPPTIHHFVCTKERTS